MRQTVLCLGIKPCKTWCKHAEHCQEREHCCCCSGEQTRCLSVHSSLLFHHSYLEAAAMCNNEQHGPNMPANLSSESVEVKWSREYFIVSVPAWIQSTASTIRPAVACRHHLILMKLSKHRQAPDKLQDIACRIGNYIRYYRHGFKLGFLLYLFSLYLNRQARSGWLEMQVEFLHILRLQSQYLFLLQATMCL